MVSIKNFKFFAFGFWPETMIVVVDTWKTSLHYSRMRTACMLTYRGGVQREGQRWDRWSPRQRRPGQRPHMDRDTESQTRVKNHGINFFLYVISGHKFRADLLNVFRLKRVVSETSKLSRTELSVVKLKYTRFIHLFDLFVCDFWPGLILKCCP